MNQAPSLRAAKQGRGSECRAGGIPCARPPLAGTCAYMGQSREASPERGGGPRSGGEVTEPRRDVTPHITSGSLFEGACAERLRERCS